MLSLQGSFASGTLARGEKHFMIDWMPDAPAPWYGATMASPIGSLWVAFTSQALVAAAFSASLPTDLYGCSLQRLMAPDWILDLFAAAFEGQKRLRWPLIDGGYTRLDRALMSKASDIPFGESCAYGTLAAEAGYPGRARAAGRAMRRAPVAYLIPTHRVIRADGSPAPCQRDDLNRLLRQWEADRRGQPSF